MQLYTLRSRGNWGIGDFSDLKQMIRWLAPRGAGFIGLNPLHALAPADPARSSPYSASSRHFLNILYIAVPDVAEFADCAVARARAQDEDFAKRLHELRRADLVDYRGVADAKFEVLELLYREFRERHLNANTERAQDFHAFVAGGGALLALACVLRCLGPAFSRDARHRVRMDELAGGVSRSRRSRRASIRRGASAARGILFVPAMVGP